MVRRVLVGAVILLAAGCTKGQEYGPTYLRDVEPGRCCTVIAHAGGAVNGNPYTNAREAMQESIAMGTHFIELDYSMTSDGRWYVTHDWGFWAKGTGYEGAMPPAAADVAGVPYKASASGHGIHGTYTVMSLEEADALAAANPGVRIVTDAKDSNLELVDAVARLGLDHYVIQAYSLEEVDQILGRYPGAQVLLTLYRLPESWRPEGFSQAFLQELGAETRIMGIAMPLSTAARPGNLEAIREATAAPIFVHGQPGEINTRLVHWKLGQEGVAGFYLD